MEFKNNILLVTVYLKLGIFKNFLKNIQTVSFLQKKILKFYLYGGLYRQIGSRQD